MCIICAQVPHVAAWYSSIGATSCGHRDAQLLLSHIRPPLASCALTDTDLPEYTATPRQAQSTSCFCTFSPHANIALACLAQTALSLTRPSCSHRPQLSHTPFAHIPPPKTQSLQLPTRLCALSITRPSRSLSYSHTLPHTPHINNALDHAALGCPLDALGHIVSLLVLVLTYTILT